MIGLRPCTYACAYVDLVLTSQSYDISINTTRTNMPVFLVLMLAYVAAGVLLAYTCAWAYAYAYALVKTRPNRRVGIFCFNKSIKSETEQSL